MGIIKHISKNFEYIWNTYCVGEIGYKILSSEEFSSKGNFPLLWGCDEELDIKILVFLANFQGKLIPFVFVSVGENNNPHNRKLPMRVKSQYKSIGDFYFSKEDLKSECIECILKEKCKSIDRASFQKILVAVSRPKRSKKEKEQPRSVYTISGGLYGLGKSRKH